MQVYVSESQLQEAEVWASELKKEARDLFRYGFGACLAGSGLLALMFLPNFSFLLAALMVIIGFALKPNRPTSRK